MNISEVSDELVVIRDIVHSQIITTMMGINQLKIRHVKLKSLAEETGFEPARELPLNTLSKRAP